MPSSPISVVDVSPLLIDSGDTRCAADEIGSACREHGFFYVTGHGVAPGLIERLEALSREFFSQDLQTKLQIEMSRAGRAWRGYFPVGGELTSGRPDQKEGIYFGSEHSSDHPRVRQRIPLHGSNLYPSIDGFGDTVREYLESLTILGHALMRGLAVSLDLPRDYFDDHLTSNPTILFRIFHYPLLAETESVETWGVGEHTDYGLLTILHQDQSGGLQIKSKVGWIEAHPIAGTFVVNIGDMLDRLTAGLYRSTLHRVRNPGDRGRLSFPFFFDPGWDARVRPIVDGQVATHRKEARWDGLDLDEFSGTYGDYLLSKVARVFPDLARD